MLDVELRAERDGDERLRFAAGEQRRTVGAGKDIQLAGDSPDFIETAAADAFAFFDDCFPDVIALEIRED